MSNSAKGSTGVQELLGSVGPFIRNNWQIWGLILSILLSLGIIQIPIVKLVINPQIFWGMLLGIVLVWSLLEVVILYVKNEKLERELSLTQGELAASKEEVSILGQRISPSFFLEDLPLSTLVAHIALRQEMHKINPVKLDTFRIDCRISGPDSRKDAEVKYYLKGTNISNNGLAGLYLSIAGDNLVPFKDLGANLYNLHSGDGRSYALKPRLEGPDSIRKDLFLPFINPGIEPYGSFEIELDYIWPSTFNPTKDFWFLDNIDFEGTTRKIIMTLEFVEINISSVRVYTFDPSSNIPTFSGVLPPDPSNSNRFIFEKMAPQMQIYYLLLFEAK